MPDTRRRIQPAGQHRTRRRRPCCSPGIPIPMPFDDGRWTRDPFASPEHDNKLYGLGTADMNFFAFILDALRDVDVTTLRKAAVYSGHCRRRDQHGRRALLCRNHRLRPDCAIIGEPTSCGRSAPIKTLVFNAIRIPEPGPATPAIRRAGSNAIELMPTPSAGLCSCAIAQNAITSRRLRSLTQPSTWALSMAAMPQTVSAPAVNCIWISARCRDDPKRS